VPRRAVTLTVRATAARTYRLTGTVRPVDAGTAVTVHRDGTRAGRAVVSASGTWSLTVRLAPGRARLEARVAASGYGAASASLPVGLLVR
jgi:hypothetical protein